MDIQSLTAAPENEQLSFFDGLPEIKYKCPNCEGLLADKYHYESEGETECLVCVEARLKKPAPFYNFCVSAPKLTRYIEQLQVDDFLFYDFPNKTFSNIEVNLFNLHAEEVDFKEFYYEFTRNFSPKNLMKKIHSNIACDFQLFFDRLIRKNCSAEDVYKTQSALNYRAILFFKDFVDRTLPGEFWPTAIRMKTSGNRWSAIGVALRKPVPEEILLADFFYYCCQIAPADFRSAIKVYRANEIMEPMMKMCFSRDKWMDERRKKLSYLLKGEVRER
jgi:hypothetical protein